MNNLNHRQDKIKERRKKTEFRDFLKEIASWDSFVFHRNNWLISRYPDTGRIKVCSIEKFNEEIDNLLKNWIDYDFSENFFSNFKKLDRSIEQPCLHHLWKNENSDFANVVHNSKNVYLSNIVTFWSENIFYSILVRINSKNIFNSLFVFDNSEIIYFSRWILNSYKIFYSSFIRNCSNIRFSSNLTWCSECIFCDDLQNSKYYINNKKYSKEEYFEEKEKILNQKEKFPEFLSKSRKPWLNYNSTNVSGWGIIESENIENGYFISNIKNWKNLMFLWSTVWAENLFDSFLWWEANKEVYWLCSGWWDENVYNWVNIWFCSNIYYCKTMERCSHCIWCIWLKNKSYCILNKQYTKEEWEHLADKIFAQMEKDWILWEFFPWELNPLYFNDTLAWMIWDFTKQEVEEQGYLRRDEEIKVDIPEWAQIIETKDLQDFQWFDNDWNWQINPEILKKVIKDKKWNYYKIVKMEYDFLVKYSLPLPEIHWIDRMKLNFGI